MSQEDIQKVTLYNLYKAVTEYIVKQELNTLQIAELQKRNWQLKDIAKYGIGACNDIEAMREYLKGLGYGTKLLDDNEFNNEKLFNPNNLLFTLYDEYGKPNGFAGRNLIYDGVKDENGYFINGPKFINVKKSAIYSKRDSMYMFHVASKKSSIPLIIVEGYADVITAHMNGLPNVCGLSMLGISETQLNMCKRHGVYDVIICLDNDEPGMAKAKDILDNVLKNVHDLRIRFIFLPSNEININGEIINVKIDPDDYIRNNGAVAFCSLPKIDPFTWRLNQYTQDDEDVDPESICFAMVSIITSEPSSIKREGMVKELSDFTGISDKAIKDEIDKVLNATEQKISRAKDAIVADLIQSLTDGKHGSAETLLTGALDKIATVGKEFNTGTFETPNRLSKLLSIKQYQESEDMHICFDFGKDFRTLNTALAGDLRQKMIMLGGVANTGKTSTLVDWSWNLIQNNPNSMAVFLTIDDSSKEFLPRVICYDVCSRLVDTDPDLFNLVNINKIATPYLYKDSFEYEAIMEQRDISFRRVFIAAEHDRYVLLDAEDGRTLDFIKTTIKTYAQKYPDRHLFFFLDNFHLVACEGFQDSRTKYKHLSHELKNTAVMNNCTIISTVEYRKIPFDRKPNNGDLAESVALEYDANMIVHLDSELHRNRDKTRAFHYTYEGQKAPIIEAIVGKNKISSYKSSIYYRFWPDKAFYQELSEAAFKDLTAANEALAYQEKCDEEDEDSKSY